MVNYFLFSNFSTCLIPCGALELNRREESEETTLTAVYRVAVDVQRLSGAFWAWSSGMNRWGCHMTSWGLLRS